jgi:hypothetical protein
VEGLVLSKKNRLIILTVIIAVVAVILILPGSIPSADRVSEETAEPVLEEFAPDEEPFRVFIEARQARKPIVLEFYARS